jgi:hypothetical protein
LLGEVINSGSDRALVCKESRDSSLVLGASSANERGVVQQSVLGSVSLGLQSSEKSLLRAENLHGRSGILGQVGQASGMRNQTSANDLSDQRSKVRSDDAHLGNQVRVQRLAILGKADNSLCERNDVLHVRLRYFLAHAVLGSINNALSNTLIILHKSSKVVQALISQSLFILDKECNLSVALVIRNDLDKFGEVPRVPLSHPHREGVDGLVKLVQNCNSLNNVVVVPLDGELDLSTGVGVTETKLGSTHITLTELLQQLSGMQPDSTKHILHNFTGVSSLTIDKRER